MVRKNGIRVLVILSVLVSLVSTGVILAQDATAVPQTQAGDQPYLGVRLEDTAGGVVVRSVTPDSAAAKAGVQVDDILQKVNSSTVGNVLEAYQAITALHPNDQATLEISRAGKAMTLTATIGSRTNMGMSLSTTVPFVAIGYNSTNQSWDAFNIADSSDLYTAGLRTGDTITQMNGKAYSPSDFNTFVTGLKDTDSVKVTVERAGKSMDVTVPVSVLKSIYMMGYDQQALLLDLVPGTTNRADMPLPTLMDLPQNVPFDALGYQSADKSWHVYALGEGSDLYTAGLRAGDSITQFDGKPYDSAALETYRQSLADSATVKLTVERAGSSMSIDAPAAALTGLDLFSDAQSGLLFGLPIAQTNAWLGADTLLLNPTVAQDHQLDVTSGLLVTGIMPDSPAAQAGLQPNDVITGVNNTTLDAQHTWQSVISPMKPGDAVTISIERGGKTMDINATLGQPTISGEIPFLMSAF